MRKRASAPFVLLALAVGLSYVVPAASAQGASGGAVRGTARDVQGAVLPGATVTAVGPASPRTFSSTTSSAGAYRLTDLPPGTYTITAESSGFSKASLPGIEIRAGLNLVVDITMHVGPVSESVNVSSETPLLEVQRPVQAVNIGGGLSRQLPLTAKSDWYGFLEVTPAVTNRSVDQSGGQVFMVRGSEIEGHVFQLDGIDIGSFRQSRTDFIQLNPEAIDDVRVNTAGAEAAAPAGVGVVVNVAAKAGTNRFNGAAGAAFISRKWNGNNADPGASAATSELFQPDISVGGPVRKDRAFFFGAFRHTRQTVGISRNPQQLAWLQGLVPGFRPFDNENRAHYEYVKGTVRLSRGHDLLAFYQNDVSPQDANWPYNGSDFERMAYGGKAYAVRLSSQWGDSIVTRLAASFNDKTLNRDWSVFEGHQNPGPALRVYASASLSGGNLAGSGLAAALNNTINWTTAPTSKLTIQGDVSAYGITRGGSHEVEAGFFLQPDNRNCNDVLFPNDGQNLVEAVLNDPANASAGYTVFHRRQMGVASFTASSVQARDYGLYVQDTWKPASRLSLTIGLRGEFVRTRDLVFDTDIEHGWNLGPRLGAAWLLTPDARNVLRASYGVLHDMPQAVLIASIGATRVARADYYDNDLDGVFESAVVVPPSTARDQSRQIDPDLHRPFVREAVIGSGHQFPGGTSVDVAWVRRYYKDRAALVEVNGIYDGVVFEGYRNEALNEIFLITNNTDNWFVYSGLDVSLSKRTRDVQVLAGYTRGWQHVDGTWQPHDPASFIQPGAFPNDRGIGTWRGFTTSSLSYTEEARNPSWQKHVLRAGGACRLPWSLTAASTFTLLSGPWSGPIFTTLPAPDPAFGPPSVVLSNGRRVPNPLATPYRFAYGTRGEGQIKAPSLLVWNVRLLREFRIPPGRLQLGIALFNATNHGADQQFLDGGNVITSANYAMKGGTWQGQNRQAPRVGQVSVRYSF